MSQPSPRERLTGALACDPVDRPPVWFMRQAGRYLPEYRKLRADHGFLEVCHTPDLAREVTLQPVDRFGLDAAILFSDILVPFEGMGRPVRYESGVGPVLDDPLRDPAAVDDLDRPDPDEAYPAVAETVASIREDRPDLGIVGFAGAPFTLACYLIEGGAPGRYQHVDRFRLDHPDAFERLLEHLGEVVTDQLEAQARAGADAVQLFDTHAEHLSPDTYAETAGPATQRVLEHLDDEPAARIAFARGTAHLADELAGLDAEAIGADWRVNLPWLAERAPGKAIQGNLSPSVLHGPPELVAERTRAVLDDAANLTGHVFNLGHGITPDACIEAVETMVRTVKEAGG